jgi:hypothetical protein
MGPTGQRWAGRSKGHARASTGSMAGSSTGARLPPAARPAGGGAGRARVLRSREEPGLPAERCRAAQGRRAAGESSISGEAVVGARVGGVGEGAREVSEPQVRGI